MPPQNPELKGIRTQQTREKLFTSLNHVGELSSTGSLFYQRGLFFFLQSRANVCSSHLLWPPSCPSQLQAGGYTLTAWVSYFSGATVRKKFCVIVFLSIIRPAQEHRREEGKILLPLQRTQTCPPRVLPGETRPPKDQEDTFLAFNWVKSLT